VDNRRVIGSAAFPDLRKFGMPRLIRTREATHAFVGAICLGLTLGFPAANRAQAETPCPIPDGLALRDIALPAVKQAAAEDRRLVILTFGGVPPAGADAESRDTTYPGRLEAALSAALPGIEVAVKNEAPPGKTSADVPAALPGLIAKTGAKLVIWGPGGRDVMARLGIETFRDAVNAGIEAVRHNGADLILLDTTFVPSPARMAAIEVYRDRLLAAAVANHVPLLRRHAMMRLWSEDGTLDLAAHDPAEREVVARHLFSCVAQGLAASIAAAVR
jgi:hypothetical protein